ncbi:MAG: hypothetical protein A3K76_04775 [Euryarchaeota archaeon RBG_13_57_23]|nr:MAG: hypothetical protein A3K76_04775 [Euryarchaeota archaeon RBG_13_57_23]
MLKVTPQMAARWVKAVFLIIIGIVILIYADRLVDDLKTAIESSLEVVFEGTWTLLTILLWILVAWLFVDAVLTIALSFSEHRYSLLDVMKRLGAIEKKLGIPPVKEVRKSEEEPVEEPVTPEPPAEEEPPPP